MDNVKRNSLQFDIWWIFQAKLFKHLNIAFRAPITDNDN